MKAPPRPDSIFGSSPRGRGKPDRLQRREQGPGLIPAWAGKTGRACPPRRGCRAHPRVGGENKLSPCHMQKELGSSPRGRGKLFTKVPVPAIMGLIPAWAGKTDWRTFESMRRRAHPRVGGENLSRPRGWGKSPGSSPRGRGKPHGARSGIPRDGLIPAWAGKTSSSASPRPPSRAHPRVGGENGNGPTAGNPMYGSSPRGRGKPSSQPID